VREREREAEAPPARSEPGVPRPYVARRRATGCVVVALAGLVALLALMLVAVAGTGGDPRSAPTTAPSTTTWPVGDRHSRLDVEDGQRPRSIGFADADTGFVLFTGRSGPAALFRTGDGGRSWQRLALDVGDRDVHGLMVLSPTALVLPVDSGGHLVSRDGGRTFTSEDDYPVDLQAPMDRRATLRCGEQDHYDGRCRRYEVAKQERAVPQQPPLRDDVDDVAEDAQGTIWAVASAQDGIFTAVSSDAGTTWRLLPDLRTPGRVDHLQLVGAPDGGELWLLATRSDGAVTAYRAEGATWRPVTDALRPGFAVKQVVTAGGGVLFLAGGGAGYLDGNGGWRPLPAPEDVSLLDRLPDGTLTAAPANGESGVWIGPGQGAERAWIHVTVEPV
jgi:photosystem II stability/assembly factor-like uncharacterized protein